MPSNTTALKLLSAAKRLNTSINQLTFAEPVSHVYNPLTYAWDSHSEYIQRFATGPRRILLLGMNPGPFGMMQTGVPFGEISAVRDWMGIHKKISKPANEHPKRLINGFDCTRSEISGRRLWGLFSERFGTADRFFADHFVVNFCPLVFLETTGRNRTPDKLPAAEASRLFEVCREHLRAVAKALKPTWVIGVGAFAEAQAQLAAEDEAVRIGRILHPSPASPAANRDWSGTATRQLEELGVW